MKYYIQVNIWTKQHKQTYTTLKIEQKETATKTHTHTHTHTHTSRET